MVFSNASILAVLFALLVTTSAPSVRAETSNDSLILYYTFDHVADGMVKDESGHGNDGKVVAAGCVEAGGCRGQLLDEDFHPNEFGHRLIAHTLFKACGMWDEASWTCRLSVPVD